MRQIKELRAAKKIQGQKIFKWILGLYYRAIISYKRYFYLNKDLHIELLNAISEEVLSLSFVHQPVGGSIEPEWLEGADLNSWECSSVTGSCLVTLVIGYARLNKEQGK